MSGQQPPDRLTPPHPRPCPDGRHNRLVRGTHLRTVLDAHHALAPDTPREPHHPVSCGTYDRARLARQVDAPVPRTPLRQRRLEPPHHLHRRIQRPRQSGHRPERRHRRDRTRRRRTERDALRHSGRRDEYDRDDARPGAQDTVQHTPQASGRRVRPAMRGTRPSQRRCDTRSRARCRPPAPDGGCVSHVGVRPVGTNSPVAAGPPLRRHLRERRRAPCSGSPRHSRTVRGVYEARVLTVATDRSGAVRAGTRRRGRPRGRSRRTAGSHGPQRTLPRHGEYAT